MAWAFGWSGGKKLVGDSYTSAKLKQSEQSAARKAKKEAKQGAEHAAEAPTGADSPGQ